MKNKLFYGGLNANIGIEEFEFTSAKKRESFVAEKVITSHNIVFILTVSYSDTDDEQCDVYVFNDFQCIKDVIKTKWSKMWLYEEGSYEEAYKLAIDLKEPNSLCYTDTGLN